MRYIREVEAPNLLNLIDSFLYFKRNSDALELEKNGFFFTLSGKSSISLALEYFKSIGILENKMDQILVPKWLGYWVYNQINEHASLTFSPTNQTKVMMVYHQYGFPQDMNSIQNYASENNIKIIEDCAHTLWLDKSNRIDKTDNLTIYSYSKFFFCYSLGGISYKDLNFQNFIKNNISNGTLLGRLYIDIVKFITEYTRGFYYDSPSVIHYFYRMAYAIYALEKLPSNRAIRLVNRSKILNEINLRKKRYAYFKERFKKFGVDEYLPDSEVCPYVIPLIGSDEKLQSILGKLLNLGIVSGIYHFDVNRNLLNPLYLKSVWILTHSGISDVLFEEQLEIIDKEMSA